MRKNHISLFVLLMGCLCLTRVSGQDSTQVENPWPREIISDKGTIVIYQPQVESFSELFLEARAAVSVLSSDTDEMMFGAVWFECTLNTDKDERIVYFEDVRVKSSKFPEIEEQKVQEIISFMEEEIPKWKLTISLDRLVASLDPSDESIMAQENLNNEPPEVIFTEKPSILILIDGEPIFESIEGSSYKYVVNTPFFLIQDDKQQYYLSGAGLWYVSDNLAGEWKDSENIPEDLRKIAEEAFTEEEDQPAESQDSEKIPGDKATVNDSIVPYIYVRTTPAELLQSDGKPNYAPIEGTSLLYMTNTDNDILMNISEQEYYILISGRWYRSKSLTSNNWAFINPKEVPEDFQNIPPDSEMASLRANIYGTDEAREAVLENEIPQTAVIDRKEASLEVEYDGKPQFGEISGTGMQYAVNTDKSVLLINGKYYCCDNAVWFESDSPAGPWTVSVAIPDEVDDLPPESPVYNVKYVHIYHSTPEVVYVGYTPGYVYSYTYMGCVYYGTGWYYRPWYGRYYYPRPVTYGFSVRYNPYTGWGFSYGVAWGGPAWVTFGWHSPYYGWWGPTGYRHGYYHGYHRGYRAGYYAGKQSGSYYGKRGAAAGNNVYRNRSNGVSRTGGNNYNPRNGQRISSADNKRGTTRPAGRSNNVYTDKNGNVFRKNNDNWQQRDNRQWKDASPSTRPSGNNQQGNKNVKRSQPQQNINNLDRDYNSRNRGTQRSNNFNSNRQNYQYSRPASPPAGNPGGRSVRGRK